MNVYDWTNIKSMMKFLIQSNNNLNPYTHSLYYDIRDKIKNKVDIQEYQSLLCNKPKEIKNIEIEIDLNNIEHNKNLKTNDNIILYDSRGFCNDKQYKLNNNSHFYKQDLIENIYNMTNNPILYTRMNSNDNNLNDNDNNSLNYNFIKSLIDYNINTL
jgi:hypothetical protein